MVTGLDCQAGRGKAAVDQVGPVLDLLRLALDGADQAVQVGGALPRTTPDGRPGLENTVCRFGSLAIRLDRCLYFLIVDLTDPTSSVTATLDGPVLAVLARAGKPMTAGDVASQMPRGSEVGVRRSLARLVEQGVVRATEMGRNRVHELNRHHVAAPIADLLAGLRLETWKRLRARLASWNPKPQYACVFGSAARADGDSHSDIDVLLVHAPFPGDSDPRRQSPGLAQLAGYAKELMTVQLTERQAAKWRRQVDELHSLVEAWTGNPLQALEMSSFEWADHRRRRTGICEEIARDAIKVAGDADPLPVLRETAG